MKRLIIMMLMILLNISIESNEKEIIAKIRVTEDGMSTTIENKVYGLVEIPFLKELLKSYDDVVSLKLDNKILTNENTRLMGIIGNYEQELEALYKRIGRYSKMTIILGSSIGLNIGLSLLCVGIGFLCYKLTM